MRIAIVGGIYGKDKHHRAIAKITPETTLEDGLRTRGCDVETFSHYSKLDGRDFNVVHVHHLSYGAIRASGDPTSAAFVYTSHDGQTMAGLSSSSFRRLAARLVISRADAVIALSEKEAEFQRRTYPLSGAVHAVIPNAIDISYYRYMRNNRAGKDGPWKLLYVGQLIKLKNVDVLLRALTLLDRPTELFLVYHNPAMETVLKDLASRLGLGERTHFVGPKSSTELAALYQRVDLLVLPSAAEALPSVITEAMACGTPVVATDVGGVREQVGDYGVIVRPGNAEELRGAVIHVIDHYETFARRGEEMSDRARRRHSIDKVVDRHLEVYSQVIHRDNPRRHSAFRGPLNLAMRLGVDLACVTK